MMVLLQCCLSSYIFFRYNLLFHLYKCFPYMYVYTLCACLMPMETKEGIVILLELEFWAMMWMLGTQTKPSARGLSHLFSSCSLSLQNFTPLQTSVFLLTAYWFINEVFLYSWTKCCCHIVWKGFSRRPECMCYFAVKLLCRNRRCFVKEFGMCSHQ